MIKSKAFSWRAIILDPMTKNNTYAIKKLIGIVQLLDAYDVQNSLLKFCSNGVAKNLGKAIKP